MTQHPIVSREAWLQQRLLLLAAEKELTRRRDALAEMRRALPWTRVEKQYQFDSAGGAETLDELFDGKSQLIMYHFMFGPGEMPCASCSFWADSFNGISAHLAQRDVSFLAVSRAPYPSLEGFARRLGWSFKWVSSGRSDFNYDFGVSFSEAQVATGAVNYNYNPAHPAYGEDMPGVSVFFKDEAGVIYHTYSCYARGVEMMNAAYNYLDLAPRGRDEEALAHSMSWLRYRDEYQPRAEHGSSGAPP